MDGFEACQVDPLLSWLALLQESDSIAKVNRAYLSLYLCTAPQRIYFYASLWFSLIFAKEREHRFHEVLQAPVPHVGHRKDLLQLRKAVSTLRWKILWFVARLCSEVTRASPSSQSQRGEAETGGSGTEGVY